MKKIQMLSRRGFLLSAGTAGAATAAAIASRAGVPRPEQKGRGTRSTSGYRASEHINNYYRTTRV
ncbi:MAG: hypothetical protein ACT4P4_26610 [Betaproteobacteria bacterium]